MPEGLQQALGPYVLVDRLASGGMAEVFVAKRVGAHGFEKRVAIKRILPNLASKPDFVKMFIDEARLAAQLDHPNIVQVFDFGEVDGTLFLAMEYVEGITASTILKAAVRSETAVPFPVAAYIVLSVLRGLDHAHRAKDPSGTLLQLVHRDVTPANMLVARSGEVKLADFGIARADVRASETRAGELKGKFAYMSPEQVQGQPVDHRTDVYSAGVALAELLMGRPLFSGSTELGILLRVRDGDLGPIWHAAHLVGREGLEILMQALAMTPEDRFLSAGTFADVLQDTLRRRGDRADATTLAAYCEARGLWTRQPGGAPMPNSGVIHIREETQASSGYRVRMPEGTVLGPLGYPELVDLITAGEIEATTPLAVGEGAFHLVRDVPELARFVTSPALTWSAAEIDNAQMTGDLSKVAVARFLYRLMSAGETGVLRFWNKTRRKKVYFVAGRPDFVGSTDRSERLGEYLVRTKVCAQKDLDRALAALPRFEGRLGDALVGLGILKSVELFRAVTGQVQERLFELFRWREGQYAYARGLRSEESTFSLGLEPITAVWEGIVRGYSLRELEALLTPHLDRVVRYKPRPGLDALTLPEVPSRVLAGVGTDGTDTPLRTILERAGADGKTSREEVYRAVYLGLACDVLAPA